MYRGMASDFMRKYVFHASLTDIAVQVTKHHMLLCAWMNTSRKQLKNPIVYPSVTRRESYRRL